MAIMAGALIDVADYGDTGWVDCTMTSGTTEVSGHDVQVRRIGAIVFVRGRMERATSTSTQEWASLPTGFAPNRGTTELPHRAAADSTTAPARVFLDGSGNVVTQGAPANCLVLLNASWVVG
jgi:hypothetical protein